MEFRTFVFELSDLFLEDKLEGNAYFGVGPFCRLASIF